MLDSSCHPPLPPAGAYRFAPDPISKRKRKKIAERRTSLYARSFVSPFSAFPRATFLVSAPLTYREIAGEWEEWLWALDGHLLGGMAKAVGDDRRDISRPQRRTTVLACQGVEIGEIGDEELAQAHESGKQVAAARLGRRAEATVRTLLECFDDHQAGGGNKLGDEKFMAGPGIDGGFARRRSGRKGDGGGRGVHGTLRGRGSNQKGVGKPNVRCIR